MVANVLVAIGHHGATTVPSLPPHDVNFPREKRVGGAHDGPDIEIVLEVLDRHVHRVTLDI